MIYKSTREEVQAYFQNPSLNQSELKLLKDCSLSAYNAEMFKRNNPEKDKIQPDHFRQGGAVDTLLTGTKEEFESLYHISGSTKLPSDTIMKIMDYAFSNFVLDVEQGIEGELPEGTTLKSILQQSTPADINPFIITACNQYEYFTNRTDESRFNSAIKAGWEYFQSLIESVGKIILPQDMYENIKAIVSNLKNSPRTKVYFEEKNFKDNPSLDIYFQKIIYFTYKGRKCKAMLDILIVDKSNPKQVVFHPIDIKTLADAAIDFPIAAKRLRYDIQGAWYKIAILHSDVARSLVKAKRDFVLNNFRFLAETTTASLRKKSLSFTMKASMLEIGFKGRPEIRNKEGEIIKPAILGIQQLLNIYEYHEKTKDFNTEKLLDDHTVDIPFGWDYNKFTYEWS